MPGRTSSPTRVRGAGSAALRRRLQQVSGTGQVLHAGRQALYVGFGDRVVGVAARGAVQVPAAIATALPRLPDVPVGSAADVVDAVLHVGGLAVSLDRLVATDVPDLRGSAAGLLAEALPDPSAVRDQLPSDALAALARGDATAVSQLVGRGDGLTPVGDDVLSGWLVAARACGRDATEVGRTVRQHARRTTTLSATLLADAVEGTCLPELRAVLLALKARHGVADAVGRLAAVGHTSGAGMLLGAHLALSSRLPAVPVRPRPEGTPR